MPSVPVSPDSNPAGTTPHPSVPTTLLNPLIGTKIQCFRANDYHRAEQKSVFSGKQIPLEADFVDEVGALAEFCFIDLHQFFTVAACREIYSY